MSTVTAPVKSPTQVTTGKVRLSYFHGFEKHKNDDDDADKEPKYSTQVIIKKTEKTTLAAFEKAIEAAKIVGKDKKWAGKIPGKLKLPLRDGDDPEEKCFGDENYKGCYFFNTSCSNKPSIVKHDAALGGFVAITDKLEVCSGDYARVSLNFFPFAGKSNGVGVGLNNILFLEKGDPLGGGNTRVEDDFADVLSGEEFTSEEEEFDPMA